jgi:hypothetical protein
MKENRKTIVILLLCLLVGFALRFHRFDQKSFWFDEIYTYQDSRDGFRAQLQYYQEKPNYLHPPLFYLLSHLFYPFTKPERDLRILPLIFGTLSIPMIFLLAQQFSRGIAFPCTLVLTFMTYHIALSQEGRAYSFILFFGMAALYFFVRHLCTGKKGFLIPTALCYAVIFHASYSAIPFIAFSQLLWLYQPEGQQNKPTLGSFLLLNALIVLFCSPWIIFLFSHYQGQPLRDPFHHEDPGSFWSILYGVLHDWVPHWPLMAVSVLLLILLPTFLKNRRNGLVLLALFFFPIAGLYLYCRIFDVTHFISSRYFINFLPLLFISLLVSIEALEARFAHLRRILRFRLIFVVLFVASNLIILPLYYRSEKQDCRGLTNYLKENLRQGDTIFVDQVVFFPGILHYFGLPPESRHYTVSFKELPEKGTEYSKTLLYRGILFKIHYSDKTCCSEYVGEGGRVWIVVGKYKAKELKMGSPAVFKGYFDGSFLNFSRFPTDASIYLFLWDPSSPNEKGIDLPME